MRSDQVTTEADSSICESVVEAIAEAEGVAATDLDVPLYEVVDPDALEQLFAPTSAGGRMRGRIRFTYGDYDVVVDGGDRVSVTPREE